jgi:hypothetical protein
VVTADHVITNNKKLTIDELSKGNVVIFCKGKDGKYKPYAPSTWGIIMESEYLKIPIKIDLALLRPILPIICDYYIPIAADKPILGEEIMIGGFPEDIQLPFSFDKYVKLDSIKGFVDIESMKKQLDLLNRLLMVKRAIISNSFSFDFNGNGICLQGNIMYFDNAMHSSGSGGPIVNGKGELLGIISERAVIELNYEDSIQGKIPSGSGLGISCDPLFQCITQQAIKSSG